MLSMIHSPKDLKLLSYPELSLLAQEIREEIMETVQTNGGHLSSNLGAVELMIALHRVYETPKDKLVFDVGHQSYAHKLLTGRQDRFRTIRTLTGLSGYPSREESEHDAFGTGHSSTAISAALGLARARDLSGEDHSVAAVLGDGALTGGEAYEALNDAGNTQTALVVVLNDNGMSISHNVGALSRTLTRARASAGYWSIKNGLTRLFNKMGRFGAVLYSAMQTIKNSIKYLFVRNGKFFDALGFVYIGKVDGHDIQEIEHALRRAKALNKPVLVHVMTCKGKGSADAEEHPDRYHGVAAEVADTQVQDATPRLVSAHVVADTLAELVEDKINIAAVTAAMPLSTGLGSFGEHYPQRMFDVGIAEGHAATLCAGLAAGGIRPFFAVYSTFMQRCYDQLIHDVALQGLPVVFLVDRAGLCGEDGATHQGVFDMAMSMSIPGVTILTPRTARELAAMIRWSAQHNGPVVIRYPRMLSEDQQGDFTGTGQWTVLQEGAQNIAVLAVGPMADIALQGAYSSGLKPWVVSVSSVKPLDTEELYQYYGMRIITVEEGIMTGGFGSNVRAIMGSNANVRSLGVPQGFIPHGTIEEQREACGLTVEDIAAAIRKEARYATGTAT